MKRDFLFYLLLFAFLAGVSQIAVGQTYSLTVNNGYGSGNYNADDTVDIWCPAIPTNQIFDRWSGDISTLESNDEWHTKLLMPAQNISVSANFRAIGFIHIQHESIMGRDTLKEVYSYFPPQFKGVIFCFHGTGGAASNWVTLLDYQQFLHDAVADTFGFIITEAEEITKQTDFDSDGKLRWAPLPYDSVTNVDFANIKILMDTFRLRGITNAGTKYYGVGMSNGGNFAPVAATLFGWSAAVSYCAQSSQLLMNMTHVPIQWCMAKYDNHPNVGPQGNADALADHNTLAGRGICTNYFLQDRSPAYPERFMRDGNISSTLAGNLFTELQNNHLMDVRHYMLYASDTIFARILAAPFSFSYFLSLPAAEKVFMSTQIDAMYAAHQFFSDYNKKTLHFFDSPCDTLQLPNAVPAIGEQYADFSIFPNPIEEELRVQLSPPLWGEDILLMDINGKVLTRVPITSSEQVLSVASLPAGIYLLKVKNTTRKVVKN